MSSATPSQCPGSARSSASAGRSLIVTTSVRVALAASDPPPGGRRRLPAVGDEVAVLDQRRLDGLRPLGDDIVAELVGVFLDTGPDHVAAIEVAYAAGDTARARREAHALRGAAGNLGFDALAVACGEVEDAARSGGLVPGGDAEVLAQWQRLVPAANELVGRSTP